jgi:transposase-like protein
LPANPSPRVINVDKNPAYPAAVDALKAEGTLPRRVRLCQCKYLNNGVEQDHRTVKKRTWLAKGYGSFQSAWRTLEDIETMSMIRKLGSSAVRQEYTPAQERCGFGVVRTFAENYSTKQDFSRQIPRHGRHGWIVAL